MITRLFTLISSNTKKRFNKVNDMISIHLMETDRGAVGGHIGKGLYYGSYRSPRVILWSIGVVIFLVMMGFNSYFFNESYFIYFTLSPIALSTLKLGNITPQLIMD